MRHAGELRILGDHSLGLGEEDPRNCLKPSPQPWECLENTESRRFSSSFKSAVPLVSTLICAIPGTYNPGTM